MLSGVCDPRCPPHDDSRSLCHCMTSLFCRSRGWLGVLLFSTPWRFCFAPRAASGRSGWASSPALRPAFACDPRALPAVRPLGVGVGQPRRIPTTASASGALTLRRHGSCGPRGGSHRHPPICHAAARGVSRCCQSGPSDIRTGLREGGFQSARRVPAAMPPEAAGTRRADRGWGIGDPAKRETPRGPRPETRCRVAAVGVSERRERGEQATSGRAPAGQNKSLTQ
jgi:hypothetical protein